MNTSKLFSTICFFFLYTGALRAAVVMDQQVIGGAVGGSSSSISLNSNWEWQQEVLVGKSGKLDSIEISFTSGSTGSIDFFVNVGSTFQTDAHDFTSTIAVASGGDYTIDVSGACLDFDVGDSFVFGMVDTGSGLTANVVSNNDASLYAGVLYARNPSGGAVSTPNFNMAFTTFVAVPEPTPALSLCFVLVGVGAVSRCRSGRQEI